MDKIKTRKDFERIIKELNDAKVYHDEDIKKQNTPFRVNVLQEGTFYGT